MIDHTTVPHNALVEDIVDVLCSKTQNTDRSFFRVEVCFFLAKIASSMRATVATKYLGSLPINNYTVMLAPSGYGKGHSVNLMEDTFLHLFKKVFITDTMPAIAENALWTRANAAAAKKGTDPGDEYSVLRADYDRAGTYPFTFDSGTTPAVKQLRQKLLLAECGAINLQIDEIGSNLLNNIEVLNAYLELYDQGKIKQKLTKNTSDSIRSIEIDGKTPANMLLFGTPNKVFDGFSTESQFYSFLETGYARRSLFAYGTNEEKALHKLSAMEVYQGLINPKHSQTAARIATLLEAFADPSMYAWEAQTPDTVAIQLVEYQMRCEAAAEVLAPHEEIRRAELAHRYFKALKLAGLFAFLDKSAYVLEEHLGQAIKIVEESGVAFSLLLDREKPYERVARFIASTKHELTHADLHEALPFYKRSTAARNEMMDMACAWGYKQHIIIKRLLRDGIEFFKGETLEESNPDLLSISVSSDMAYNYNPDEAPFDQLHVLATAPDMHWCNHRFKNQHRNTINTIPGFNMVVFDIDGGTKIETAQSLLDQYKYFIYTTKRHTDQEHRFRIILPINYVLYFDEGEYGKFMGNLADWLPFDSDRSAAQRCRKWLTNPNAKCFSNEGKVLDALQFIPATSKNEQYKQSLQSVQSLSQLERWFVTRMEDGNRNNQMIKYALALKDTGMGLVDIRSSVFALNSKIPVPLTEEEIKSTVLTTVAKRMEN